MSILSVPLSPKHEKMVNKMVKDGVAANKAEVARLAIEKLAEDRAVQDVLDAQQELKEGKLLTGDLDELVKKL